MIFTMGGIGQNLQLQSDDSEILYAIRGPHKTYAYQILWQNRSYFASYGEKMSVSDIINLGLVIISQDLMIISHRPVTALTSFFQKSWSEDCT